MEFEQTLAKHLAEYKQQSEKMDFVLEIHEVSVRIDSNSQKQQKKDSNLIDMQLLKKSRSASRK